MKTRLLLTLFCLTCVQLVWAQEYTIKGKILDHAGEGLPFANVFLQVDSNVIEAVFSEVDGSFSMEAETGSYKLKIASLGFADHEQEITLTQNIDVGVLSMNASSEELETVFITGFQNESKAGIDKKSVYISEDMRRANASVSELLELMPIVNMDFEGKPSVPGKRDVVVLVDGRPPKVRANDLATTLRTIPSDQVVKIEVMTNPPAKYTQGNSAVINIVTNKKPQKGNLINLWTRVNSFKAVGAGLNWTYKYNRFSISLWSGRWEWIGKSNGSSTTINKLAKDQYRRALSSENQNRSYGYWAGVSPEWKINDKNTISAFFGTNTWNNDSENSSNQTWYNNLGEVSSIYNIEGDYKYQGGSFYTGLEYFRTFDEEEKELELSFEVGQYPNKNNSLNHVEQSEGSYYQKQISEAKKSRDLYFSASFFDPIDSNSNINYAFDIGTDFPFDEKIQTFWGEDENALVLDPRLNYLNTQRDFTQEFSITYSKQFNKSKIQLDLGQRYRHINYFYNQQERVKRDFWFFTPKINYTYALGESNEVGLTYRFGQDEPRFYQLNPLSNPSSDSTFISMGNPELDPESGHNLELNFSLYVGKTNIGLVSYYRYTHNSISTYRYSDALGIQHSTYLNNSKKHNAGLEFNLSTSLGKRGKLNFGSNVFYASLNDPLAGSQSNFSYNFNASLSYKIFWDIRTRLVGRYQGPEIILQGVEKSLPTLDASLSRNFLKDKLTLSVRFENIFQSRIYKVERESDTFYSMDKRTQIAPWFSLRLNYRIGNLKDLPKSSKIGQQ